MTSAAETDVPQAYPPSAEFAAAANAGPELQAAADTDRLAFWANQAERLHWHEKWTDVLDWTDAPVAKWFVGGKLNVAYNCVDRHVLAGNGDRVAIHFEGEPGDSRDLTYNDLLAEVSRAANTFTDLGLVAGDRVAIYMPMIPEAIVTMLACARLGLTHSVVFAGFSATALRSRIDDAQAKLVVTVDGQWRRGAAAPIKTAVDESVAGAESVQNVLVVNRTGIDVEWTDGRDLWWHETVAQASPEHEAQAFDAEHPLFILYTSGTTGKPKGIIHTSGGYLTQPRTPTTTSSITKRDKTSTGAPPTSAGSPDTPTSSTDPSRTASPRSSTKAPPTPRTSTATSTSSRSTASPSTTPHPPSCGRS